jgi:hypothetical protein
MSKYVGLIVTKKYEFQIPCDSLAEFVDICLRIIKI